MAQLLYYLTAFSDEVVPCTPELEAWAAWLAKPIEEVEADGWSRGEIEDGAEFVASILEIHPNIAATRTADGWTYDAQPPADASFFAVRNDFGSWDVDTIHNSLDEVCQVAASDDFCDVGETLQIAIGADRPRIRVRFNRTPAGPTLTVLGQVQ